MIYLGSAFLLSLLCSLLITPLAARLGYKLGGLDDPNRRKIHSRPVPRTGGAAVFTVFVLALTVFSLWSPPNSAVSMPGKQMLYFLGGGFMVLAVGLVDDFYKLGYKTKFLFQIAAASLAFWAGLRIEVFYVQEFYLDFGFLAYFVTLFWFLLFMNAINLADGMDGLAGGLVFFASLVMILLLAVLDYTLLPVYFSILAGAVLGFLFYNLNPAKVFLGDSGSYFLGYTIAGLSILGSVKSQVSSSLFLPLVALGIPVMDTLIAPVRRILSGRKMFHPDRGHIHHRLLHLGLSTPKSVWVLYILTTFLCLISLVLANIRNTAAGLILICIGIAAVIFLHLARKWEIPNPLSILPGMKGHLPLPGLLTAKTSRRNLKRSMRDAQCLEDAWDQLIRALNDLEIDQAELQIKSNHQPEQVYRDRPQGSNGSALVWSRNGGLTEEMKKRSSLFKYEIPIKGSRNGFLGKLVLLKDMSAGSGSRDLHKSLQDIGSLFARTLEKDISLK